LAAAAIAGVAATYGLSQLAGGGDLGAPSMPVPSANTRENRTTVNNITVQSVDSEGAARAVAKVLNESASRSVPQLYNSGITRAR
jgi:hypothetical protein